jgi:hypothetical protein
MAVEKFLTRAQIAAFVGNDPEAIRAIERLFAVTSQLTPDDIVTLNAAIEANTLALGGGQPQAEVANAILSQLTNVVQGMALAPAIVPPKPRVYAQFYDRNTQTVAAINTATIVSFDTTNLSFGVYLSGTKVTFRQEGLYNVQHSVQIAKATAGRGTFFIWYTKNGTNVIQTTRRLIVEGGGSVNEVAGNYVFQLQANDYIELNWAVDDVAVELTKYAIAAPVPATPSAILTVSDMNGGW